MQSAEESIDRSHPPSVSVIVPCRNAAATLGLQLEALGRQDYPGTFEVIVSDNGSSDRSVAVARSVAGVRVIDASGVRGPNHARNAGAVAARGEVILTCDADDVVDERWISAMARALADADLAGGTLEFALLNSASQAWPAPERIEEPRFGFLPSATGANFGIRAEVLAALGGWDESMDGGPDDTELCWRAQLAGHRFTHAPDAVVHYRLRSTGRGLARQGYEGGLRLPMLFARFRGRGLGLRSVLATAGRHAAYLAFVWPLALVSRRHRLEWLRRLGVGAGVARGTLRRRRGLGEIRSPE